MRSMLKQRRGNQQQRISFIVRRTFSVLLCHSFDFVSIVRHNEVEMVRDWNSDQNINQFKCGRIGEHNQGMNRGRMNNSSVNKDRRE